MGEDRRDAGVMADPRWVGGRVRSGQRASVAMAWLAAVTLLGFAGILVWKLLPQAWAEGSPWAWAMLASPLPGLHALAHAARQTWLWRRFGTAVLELDPFPGSLGGHVGGRVEVALGAGPGGGGSVLGEPAGRVRVILSCVHTRISRGTGRTGRSRWDSVVWSEEVEPAVSRSASGIACAFAVAVPADLPPTEPASDSYHHWAVRVVAELPGVDFDQTFPVPVLATPEPLHARLARPSPRVRPRAQEGGPGVGGALGGSGALGVDLGVAAAASGAAGARLPRRIVRVTPTPRGLRLHYPMGRQAGASLMAALFGAFFAGMGVFVGGQAAGELSLSDLFGLVFGGVTGLIGLVFVLFGLLLVLLGGYMLVNSLEVDVGSERVASRRRLLGIPGSRREAALAELEGIEMKITGQMGQGAQAKVSYRIAGRLAGGRTIALGDGIRGTPVASALAELIEAATGRPVEKVARSRAGELREKRRSAGAEGAGRIRRTD